jgi:hypothetical protein
MLKKVLFAGLLSSCLWASQEGAKFLVIENELFNKIETLNILNGGIKKDKIIKSTRINEDNMKKYYPEYFLYEARECVKINDMRIKNGKNSNRITTLIKNETQIKEEIKKIKLLQVLTDYGNVYNTSKVSKEIIEAVGIICDQNIYFRGKSYKTNDTIGTIKINKIDTNNGIIHGEQK